MSRKKPLFAQSNVLQDVDREREVIIAGLVLTPTFVAPNPEKIKLGPRMGFGSSWRSSTPDSNISKHGVKQ